MMVINRKKMRRVSEHEAPAKKSKKIRWFQAYLKLICTTCMYIYAKYGTLPTS
jgi:hypothetical protein